MSTTRSRAFTGTITVGQKYNYFIELASTMDMERAQWKRTGTITLFDAGHGYIGTKIERAYFDCDDEFIVANLKDIAKGGF